MAGVLSQTEIDNLVAGFGIPDGDVSSPVNLAGNAEVSITSFDFQTPHRLSSSHLRTLHMLHESFSESFGSYLVSRLQTATTVSVSSVSQILYSEYVQSIPSPSCLYVFRLMESNMLGIMEIRPELVLAVVSRLLGGSSNEEPEPRHITKIEQNIMKGIQQRALTDLQNAWRMIATLTFTNERYETERDFAQIASATTIVFVASFDVSFGEIKIPMSVCLPIFALDNVLAKMSNQQLSNFMPGSTRGEWKDDLEKQIQTTSVPIEAILGKTTLSLQDLMVLEQGDIIRTVVPLECEIPIMIRGRRKFLGKPGIHNGKFAVKITRVENDLNEGV